MGCPVSLSVLFFYCPALVLIEYHAIMPLYWYFKACLGGFIYNGDMIYLKVAGIPYLM